MFRRSVLIVAFVFSVPVLWSALVDRSVSLEAAGIRFLIAVPIAAVLVGLVRFAARKPEPEEGADDAADDHLPAA
jgi:hypothetical protein